MTWFRLDDSFHSHPKVIAAGNEAVGLFVRCGTYAAQHLTDGFIRKDIALLYGSRALADVLVTTGLWHRARGGWTIHDYLDYNPSKEAVENSRKANAQRQRRYRSETVPGHNRDSGSIPIGNGYPQAENDRRKLPAKARAPAQDVEHNAVTNAATNGVSNSAPSRPVPRR